MKKKKTVDSRKITESLPHPSTSSGQEPRSISEIIKKEITLFTMLFLSLCFIFLLFMAGWFYINYQDQKGRWLAARDNLWYWQEVAVKQKNSPDAYYQAAVYAVELGQNGQGYTLLQKALDLDPEFEKAKVLQGRITNNE